MNITILRLAIRESGMYVVPIVMILVGYILFRQDPLIYFDVIVTLLAAALGFFLSWRSFADYGNVRAFFFSRSYSPTRFFLVRWLFGLGMIAVLGIIVAAVIMLGIRQSVQQFFFASGWYPMIRFEELRVLMSYVFASLLTYHTTLYFMLANRFRPPIRRRGLSHWFRLAVNAILIIYVAILIVMLAIVVITMVFYNFEKAPLFFVPYLYVIFGIPVLLQIIFAPWFGIYCYNNQEIES
jgi:hypothetical protein